MVLQGANGVLSVPDAVLSGIKTDIEGRALELRQWPTVRNFLMSVMKIEDVAATAIINEFPTAPIDKNDHCFNRLAFADFCKGLMDRGHTVQLVNGTPVYVHNGDRIFAGFVPRQLKATRDINCTQPWVSSQWYEPPGWNNSEGKTVKVDRDFGYAFVGPQEQGWFAVTDDSNRTWPVRVEGALIQGTGGGWSTLQVVEQEMTARKTINQQARFAKRQRGCR